MTKPTCQYNQDNAKLKKLTMDDALQSAVNIIHETPLLVQPEVNLVNVAYNFIQLYKQTYPNKDLPKPYSNIH